MHWNQKNTADVNTLATQTHEHDRQSASSTSVFRFTLYVFKPYLSLWIKSVQFSVH